MDKIVVLDFGGQYAHLIANRIRRYGVFSEIKDGEALAEELKEYKGIILSGGPASTIAPGALHCDPKIFELGIPVLGICYGHQLMAYTLGGKVAKGEVREYGAATIHLTSQSGVFAGQKPEEKVWMSHFDQVVEVPEGFEIAGSTKDCEVAAMINEEKNFYGIQFHAEVTHTENGEKLLKKFVEITGAEQSWNIDAYIERITTEIQEKVGDKKVFLMISGGVDSSVAFLLLEKALGPENVYALLVDTGFMRKNEVAEVQKALSEVGVTNLHVYNAEAEYLKALEGVYDPEEKRNIIGELFIDIKMKVSDELGLNADQWILGQGTIYPDTIETGGTKHADKIKTHHNRVDRVQKLIDEGKVIEPIADLYKDEVRMVGKKLGLRADMVERHPFPGPGLAVRMLCTEKEYLPANVKELEEKMNKELEQDGLKAKILPIKSVGVQGDERTYANPVVLYGKPTNWDRLHMLATHLTNQNPEVNRVIYGLRTNGIEMLTTQKKWLVKSRVSALQKADSVAMNFIKEKGLLNEIWQMPTVLIPVSLDGENESVVLRPVQSTEAMTANFYQMQSDLAEELADKLVDTGVVSGVFYDITDKPPGTIEWE